MPSHKNYVERCKNQHNPSVHGQPRPRLISEEREIDTDDESYHCCHENRDDYLLARFTSWFNCS